MAIDSVKQRMGEEEKEIIHKKFNKKEAKIRNFFIFNCAVIIGLELWFAYWFGKYILTTVYGFEEKHDIDILDMALTLT